MTCSARRLPLSFRAAAHSSIPEMFERLRAGDERADVAILRDIGKRFQPIGEGDHLVVALLDEQRHGSLNGATWIDQHNTHGDLSKTSQPKSAPALIIA